MDIIRVENELEEGVIVLRKIFGDRWS